MHKIGIFPLIALLFCAQAGAHPGGPPVPPPEALATVAGLSAAQQAEVRKIMIERRDALESVEDKAHADMQALHKRVRSEHERIEEANAEKLRKALGDEQYLRFAQWLQERHGPPGMMGHGGRGDRGGPGGGPGGRRGPGPQGQPQGGDGKGAPLAQYYAPQSDDVDDEE